MFSDLGGVIKAIPIIMPFSAWHESANEDKFIVLDKA